jgi:hypothetical protein
VFIVTMGTAIPYLSLWVDRSIGIPRHARRQRM